MKNTRRSYALLAPLAFAVFALAGCSAGGGASGTHVAEYEGLVVVEGDTVTWGEQSCDDVSEIDAESSKTSVGTLGKERATIAWTQEGRYSGTDPFTESEDGTTLTVGDKSWTKLGTAAADAILADKEKSCADYKATLAERAEAKAERDAEAAGVASEHEASATSVIDAFLLMGDSEVGQPGEANTVSAIDELLQKNSITAADMLEYLEVSEDVLMGVQAKSPDHAAALVTGLQMLSAQ